MREARLAERATGVSRLAQEFKPSDFGVLTRKVAVLLTVRREMEIAKGITRRESRRMEKRAKVRMSMDERTVVRCTPLALHHPSALPSSQLADKNTVLA